MDRQELYIENQLVELTEDVAVALNFAITDIAEPEKVKADYSKTITLPGSTKINQIFSHIYNVNVDLEHSSATFNPNIRAEARYSINSVELIDGFLQLKKINIKDGCITYDVNLFGRNANLFNDIGEKLMTELDISEFNHDWTMANESDSWATQIIQGGVPVPFAIGNGYVYPMIDYGFDNSEDEFAVDHFCPSVYAKTYWDKIFEDAGYTYNSTFLTSNYFKSLIIPSNAKKLRLSAAQVEDRKVIVNNAVVNPKVFTTAASPTSFTIRYPFNAPAVQDNLGQFDFVNDEAIIAQDGYYNVIAELNYNVEFDSSVAAPGITVDSLFGVKAQIQIIVERGGVPTVENTKDIYIYHNGSFVNTYTTALNPAPPSDEYWSEVTTTAVAGLITPAYTNVLSTNNLYNPASISICNADEIFIKAGEKVYVQLKYELFFVSPYFVTGTGTELFFRSGGNFFNPADYYNGEITLNINAADLRIVPGNSVLVEGNTIDMNVCIPEEVKQKEFVKGIINMHNLYVQPDRDNPKILEIEPRDAFYTTDVMDWSSKLDTSNEILIEPLGALKFRDFEFTYKSDKDYYNELYEDTYNEIYGYRRVILDNEFLRGSKKIEAVFSPTPLVGDASHDRIISEIFKTDKDNNKVALDINIRILYYGGLKTTNNSWLHTSNIVSDVTRTDYAYAGHLDDAYNPTLDLNWGLTKEVYYNNNYGTVNVTIAGLVNLYYFNYIREISNENSKIVTAYFNLNAKDINELSFKKQYFFNNSYYRLQQVVDYSPLQRRLTKCVFIKLADIIDFFDVSNILNGGSATVTGGVDNETLPSFDSPFKDDNRR
jgi:hypothetical protein